MNRVPFEMVREDEYRQLRELANKRGFSVAKFAGITAVVVGAILALVIGLVIVGSLLPSPNQSPQPCAGTVR